MFSRKTGTCGRHGVRIRQAIVAMVLLGAAIMAPLSSHPPTAEAAPAQPNLVVIMLDDATYADVSAMANARALIGGKGATLTNAYVPYPECCPSRATLLTGLYPHNHGVLDSQPPDGGWAKFDDTHTLATWLDPTHRTALIGKYLNGYGGGGADPTYVPPGWDYWAVPYGVDYVYNYVNRKLNLNGSIVTRNNVYSTTLYGNLTTQFIADSAAKADPFALFFMPIAPHAGKPADPEDLTLPSPYVAGTPYQNTVDASLPNDPSINETDVSDKPQYVSQESPLSRAQLNEIAEVHAQRTEAVAAADAQVKRVIRTLSQYGVLDSTYVLLTSDNGFMQGQHRILTGKSVPYQPAVRMPVMLRGPGIAPGTSVSHLVGEQDLAPTLLDLVDQSAAHTGPAFDGRILAPLLDGTGTPSARPILLEIGNAQATNPGPRVLRGLVDPTGWKLVDYTGAEYHDELYNLKSDPYEMNNRIDDPALNDREATLRAELAAYRACSGSTCR